MASPETELTRDGLLVQCPQEENEQMEQGGKAQHSGEKGWRREEDGDGVKWWEIQKCDPEDWIPYWNSRVAREQLGEKTFLQINWWLEVTWE